MSRWPCLNLQTPAIRLLGGIGVLGCLVAFAACTAEPGDRDAAGQSAFIERLGNDTVSVEVFTRTANGFTGDVLVRTPVTRVAHYEATLTPEGTIGRMTVEWSTPPENPEGPPPMKYTYDIEGDSAAIVVEGGRNPGTTVVAVPAGVIPTVGKSPMAFAVFQQATVQAAASGSDSFPVYFLSAGRGQVSPNAVKRLGGDTISVDYFGSPIVAEVDSEGDVMRRSGERTTVKMVGEPASNVDFQALAADFAARDARGEGMGVASPQATVEAEIGGASIEIVYSRPAKRGREVWGGLLVPYNEVWRTGANAATSFSTDRDLEIGGVVVPAGEYTLFSIYGPESAQLIVNKQTGQWGTVYDEGQDLARIDMTRESLPAAVERFTIEVEPSGEGGTLQLSWDRTRLSVPLKVR
jgi:hypothetical protein